jgi:hypothetical protein
MTMTKLGTLAGLGLLLLYVASPRAATLRVDGRGQTPGAFVTLAAAAAAVRAGDTIELVAGSGPYREILEVKTAGTAAAPIVIDGNGELVTGFDPFSFTWNATTSRYEFALPAPIGNTPGGSANAFRQLVTYRGQRLLRDRAGAGFTTGFATLSADGLTLVLGSGSPSEGWEIARRSAVVRISGSKWGTAPFHWHHVYRNLRASGSTNDGFNVHGSGVDLRFENIEAFNNFDEGFSAHDGIRCTIDGARLWGNDNGLYNQSKASIAIDANDVQAFANLGAGISMRQGVSRLTNSQAWDNGRVNLALGGTFETRSVSTYDSRWAQPPFMAYQETQGQRIGDDDAYTFDAYWRGLPADTTHQAYVASGEGPDVLAQGRLPPIAMAYADWRYAYFSASQAADTSVSGESADPDGDGRSNLDEYQQGTHPVASDIALPWLGVRVPDARADSFTGDSARIMIERRGSLDDALSVSFTMEGSAVPGTDYAEVATSVEIPAGVRTASVSIVPLSIVPDSGTDAAASAPSARYAVLRIAPDPAYRVGAATGTVIIDSVDTPVVNLSVPDPTASEIDGETALLRLRRSGPTERGLRIGFTLAGTATSGVGCADLGTFVEFLAGSQAVDWASPAPSHRVSSISTRAAQW